MNRAKSDNNGVNHAARAGGPFAALMAQDQSLGLKVLAASPDSVMLLDVDGNVRFINENGQKLLEADNDGADMDGHKWLDLWPSGGSGKPTQALKDAQDGTASRFSGLCPTLKGTPKWLSVTINPIASDDTSPGWLLVISRDISNQKFTEKALRVSEDRFRAVADNIAQFAWMADPSGYVFWYNKRWFDYTGTTFEDVAGSGWKKVHHPDFIERVAEKFAACIESGKIWDDTFPLRSASGEYRWFLSRAMPIRDENGEITLWCGTNTDITDQRNASQRLRQLARLVELSHEAILVRSPDSGILLWNRGCEDIYGYSQAEALGKNTHTLLKTSTTLSEEQLEDMLRTEGSWSGEVERVAKDGTKVWIDCRKQVLRTGDNFVILETDHDITGRKKADAMRNLLVAELNHRVKNTLAIVQSIASQTARASNSKEEFVASFTGRLQSLSYAHNVLTDRNWASARVHDLVASQIQVVVSDTKRVSISGPDVDLPPQLSLQLTLMLHELATNAVKHGALSGTRGAIDVTWDVVGGQEPKLALTWTEDSGRAITQPTSRGFGFSLIERSARLPHIDATIEFSEHGLTCRVLADLEAEGPPATTYFDPSRKRAVAND